MARVEGIRWLSLQKGPKAAQARGDGAAIVAIDLEPHLDDLCDAAAAISRMDLVICVDTAIAHLAGALGKPVWLLLPQPADWRWMTKGSRSPWYPRMTLFRQTERGNWSDVIDNVAAALRVWAAQERRGDVMEPGEALGATDSTDHDDLAAEPASRLPDGISAIAETRYGILQYLPQQPRRRRFDSMVWRVFASPNESTEPTDSPR